MTGEKERTLKILFDLQRKRSTADYERLGSRSRAAVAFGLFLWGFGSQEEKLYHYHFMRGRIEGLNLKVIVEYHIFGHV